MENERYHRQTILDGFGEQAQSKLAQAKVLVIGAGGLGCPALQYLAAMGVGTIGIADDDYIAISNLHRQVLYSTADIGKLKVTVAEERIREMNPELKIVSHPVRINAENILEIFKDYDMIFDGSDNFETRYLVNDACKLLKKPLVFAAVSGYEGQLAVFNVPDQNGISTNYRDLFPISPKPGEIANCEENGVLGVLPGLIGTMAATEIIKLITGIGKPLINQLLHYNLLNNEQYVMNISPGEGYQIMQITNDSLDSESRNNERSSSYQEIGADQLNLFKTKDNTLFIDVREKHEIPQLDPTVFKQVPMSTFDSFLQTTVQEKEIILLCQHGIRSVAAAEALHDKYGDTKNIYSLKGGIVKWRSYFS